MYVHTFFYFVVIRRCHGEKNNVVYELAKDTGLLSSNTFTYVNFPLYLSNGVRVPSIISEKLVNLAYELIGEADTAAHPPDTSLGNYFMHR